MDFGLAVNHVDGDYVKPNVALPIFFVHILISALEDFLFLFVVHKLFRIAESG